jgi:hypothetical protein
MTTRKRRTPEEVAAYHQSKLDAANKRVAERREREAAAKADAELARRRKVLAGLDAVGVRRVELALGGDPHSDAVAILRALRGESTDG